MLFAVPLLTAAQTLYDATLRADVKTVQLYGDGSELAPPLLSLNSNKRLVLEFDVLRAQPEELHWRIVHCNHLWQPDSLDPIEFISGFASSVIDNYDFSFTTLTDYVHYRALLPDKIASFTYSGNYIVEVYDTEDNVLLRRRFYVSEQAAKTNLTLTRPYDGVDIQRRQEIDVLITPSQTITANPLYMTVVARQNGRLDNERNLEFNGFDGLALAYRHRPANIFHGGNTFRFFDCSNLHTLMYNVIRVEEYGGETFAILRPEEDRSRKHFLGETNLNGGMKINITDRDNPRIEADYVWVNFSLPMAQPMLDRNIYIVGALTDWKLDSTSCMDYNPEQRAYTKRLLLKQGYYAYQLIVCGYAWPTDQSHTATLEGDHRETPNEYTVFVYYRSPADRADRLLSVGRNKQ